MHIPYTYLIRHIPTNRVYYGVRYARGCHPSDLWVSYFTSSKDIKRLIAEYGVDSFQIEIRKQFSDPKKAVAWEIAVLRRMNAIHRPDFINRGLPGMTIRFTLSEETKIKMRKPKSVPRSKTHIDKIVAKTKGVKKGPNSAEHNANISKATKGKHAGRVGEKAPRYGTKKSTGEIAKMKESKLAQARKWMTNGTSAVFVSAKDIDLYLQQGYTMGRKL